MDIVERLRNSSEKSNKLWNTRPELDRLKALNAELVEALEKTKTVLDEMFNHSKWYCPECAALIPSEKVTYDELCEDCETCLTPHQEQSPYFIIEEALEKAKVNENE